MKVRASVKAICRNCKIIKRHGVVRVICSEPKDKQRQGSLIYGWYLKKKVRLAKLASQLLLCTMTAAMYPKRALWRTMIYLVLGVG